MYVYMYVCMYACMHVCMYVCMYVSVKLSVQREWVLGSMPQAGRTIEKGVFYVRLGRPVSGIASAHRQYHLVQPGGCLRLQPCCYEKKSGRARMSAQITKNNKKRVAVKT